MFNFGHLRSCCLNLTGGQVTREDIENGEIKRKKPPSLFFPIKHNNNAQRQLKLELGMRLKRLYGMAIRCLYTMLLKIELSQNMVEKGNFLDTLPVL